MLKVIRNGTTVAATAFSQENNEITVRERKREETV